MLNVIFVFIVLKNIRLLIGNMDINKIVLILKVGIYIYVLNKCIFDKNKLFYGLNYKDKC